MSDCTFSVIIETENLAEADVTLLERCLESLDRQDLPISEAREVFLLTSGLVPEEMVGRLRARFPWVQIRTIPDHTGYYASKNLGAEIATGDLLVFADSDCAYDPGWLRAVLTPFSTGYTGVISGNVFMDRKSAYGMAMALTYVFDAPQVGEHLQPIDAYLVNCTAFERDLLLRIPLPTIDSFRGTCRVHSTMLREQGAAISCAPEALVLHPPPKDAHAFINRFLLMGGDSVLISLETHSRPRLLALPGALAGKFLAVGQRARIHLQREPRCAPTLLAALPITLCALWIFAAGAVAECLAPRQMAALRRRQA